MTSQSNLYGLVVCGGESRRMGFDKGSIVYFEKPQRYHLYEMLSKICDKVFISCNKLQSDYISSEYRTLTDSFEFENTGPMAALLTAFKKYPFHNFLAVGCDYPFLTEKELSKFLKSVSGKKDAAAFFNCKENLYEPLIGWYSFKSTSALKKLFNERNYSLQYYLKTIDAEKYTPDENRVIESTDTLEEFDRVKAVIEKS